MIRTVTYTCEVCGNQSGSAIDIVKCECSHLGITVDQLREWKLLKQIVKMASHSVGIRKNAESEQVLDKAIKDLNDFETKHQLIGKSIPNMC